VASFREPTREFVLVLEAVERTIKATWEIRQAGSLQPLEAETATFPDRDAAYQWGVLKGREKGFVQIVIIDRATPSAPPLGMGASKLNRTRDLP
jgi:hypothetical protein